MNTESIRKQLDRLNERKFGINMADILTQSYKTKVDVLNNIGFPVISKRIAGKIQLLQNPTDKNKTVRHAIIAEECGIDMETERRDLRTVIK